MSINRVEELQEQIADLKRRWPAHSVPAGMMEQLDDLEQELRREVEKSSGSMDNPIADVNQKVQYQGLKSVGDLAMGRRGIVRHLRGGEDFTHRMVALGFIPGVEVTIVQNYGRGPILVAIRDTHIALGRGEALKVLIEVL